MNKRILLHANFDIQKSWAGPKKLVIALAHAHVLASLQLSPISAIFHSKLLVAMHFHQGNLDC